MAALIPAPRVRIYRWTVDPDERSDSSLDQRQLDDLAALRSAAQRRRGLVPGSEAHQRALDEERAIARRIRSWASQRPIAARDATTGDATSDAAATDPTARQTPSGDPSDPGDQEGASPAAS